jgi:protein-S-isoprenylcysteine O-methyltransferase Ste14
MCWAVFWAYWLIAARGTKSAHSTWSRRVRHPIYTGLILALLGTALAITLYGLIAVAVLGGFFIYSATREEAYLPGEFPDAYPAYKRSPKMLIPFIF